MACLLIRAICLLALLPASARSEQDDSPRRPYPPKIGTAHPPLALWNLTHDESISITHFRGKKVLVIFFASWSKECRDIVPAWYETLRDEVQSGKLVILGVAVEPYPDRARLFAHWKQLTGPMVHDPVNLMRLSRLPLIVGVDENGYVRAIDPELKTVVRRFVDRKFPGEPAHILENTEEPPNTLVTRRFARQAKSPGPYIDHGDAVVIAGLAPVLDEAIEFYQNALAEDRRRADGWFGLGVAARMRFESELAHPEDLQIAVDAWARAAKLMPDNEIYQKCFQHYAPPYRAPYPLYDWVKTARSQIAARGDEPVGLRFEPMGPELGAASRRGTSPPKEDSSGASQDDVRGLVRMEQAVVRSAEKDRSDVRQIYLAFRPLTQHEARWSVESAVGTGADTRKGSHRDGLSPLRVWLKKPAGAEVEPRYIECTGAAGATGIEPRLVCFTVTFAEGARKNLTLRGHAEYEIGGGAEGPVRYRREIEIKLRS